MLVVKSLLLKLLVITGRAYTEEIEGTETEERAAIYCGWQNTYHADSRLCDFDLTLFEEMPDGSYRRSDEHQRERCYMLDEIKAALSKANLELLGLFSDTRFSAPTDTTDRWYFVARAIKDPL